MNLLGKFYLLFILEGNNMEHAQIAPSSAPSNSLGSQNAGGNSHQSPAKFSYSAIAAKQNNGAQQFPTPPVNNNTNKNRANSRPPGFGVAPTVEPNSTVPVVMDTKISPINQEQLNNAKQQYISNAKQAVASGNINLPKPPVNQSPMSTTVQSVSANTSAAQPSRQPVVSTHTSTGPVTKLSYSRIATSKMDSKTNDPIQGTTPRGQGELSKFGKYNKITMEDGM